MGIDDPSILKFTQFTYFARCTYEIPKIPRLIQVLDVNNLIFQYNKFQLLQQVSSSEHETSYPHLK